MFRTLSRSLIEAQLQPHVLKEGIKTVPCTLNRLLIDNVVWINIKTKTNSALHSLSIPDRGLIHSALHSLPIPDRGYNHSALHSSTTAHPALPPTPMELPIRDKPSILNSHKPDCLERSSMLPDVRIMDGGHFAS